MIKDLDLDKYEDRLQASRRRRAAAMSFTEGDRVATQCSVHGSYFSWLLGVNIKEYYTDIDTQIHVQTEAIKWRLENLDDDRTDIHIGLDRGPIGEALVFDCDVVYPEDTSPWIRHKLATPEDIDQLEVQPPEDNPRIAEALERGLRFKERAEELGVKFPVSIPGVGIHPPLSCACAIMDPADVYLLMLEDPRRSELLFAKCFDAFCAVKEYSDRKLYGHVRSDSLGLADDNSAFVSDDLYQDQVLPWNLMLYERYGKQTRYLHADGPNHHHYATYAQHARLTHFDIGGWSELRPAVRHFKGKTVINGNLNNIDFYGDLDDKLKWKIRNCLRIAAPGGGYILAIGGETYPGANLDTLCAGFAYAHEVGKYPLELPAAEDDPAPPGAVETYRR